MNLAATMERNVKQQKRKQERKDIRKSQEHTPAGAAGWDDDIDISIE